MSEDRKEEIGPDGTNHCEVCGETYSGCLCDVETRLPNIEGPTAEKCPDCGATVVWRNGNWGPFMACSAYPKCRWKYSKRSGGFSAIKVVPAIVSHEPSQLCRPQTLAAMVDIAADLAEFGSDSVKDQERWP